MKKVLFTTLAVAAVFCSCTKDLENRVDALETKVAALETKVNDNVTTIVQLVQAQRAAVTVSAVEDAKDGNGYTITFSNGKTAKITNGKDAEAPVVGVKEVDGVLYWTVNGEFMLNGEAKVPVTGENGKTPKFKIEDGAWKVSFDGETWEAVPVTGTVAPTLVMEETDAAYKFTLGEQVITILKDLVIKVTEYTVEIEPASSFVIKYTLTGADETTHVLVEAKNFTAEVDEAAKTVTVTAPAKIENGYIVLKAVRNSDAKYSAQYINIEKASYGSFGSAIISNDKYNW